MSTSGEIMQGLPVMLFPDTVFFPHTFIDWEVERGNLADMFQKAQEHERLIGIFLQRENAGDELAPPYEQPGTFGRVSKTEATADGLKITLHGKFRADIIRITRFKPVMEVEARVRGEHLHFTSAEEMRGILKDAIALAQQFKPAESRARVKLPSEDKWAVLFTMLVNSIASFLPTSSANKQEWLREDDLLTRYRMIREEMVRTWTLGQLMEQAPMKDDPRLN
jgi:Lon protease-like protein